MQLREALEHFLAFSGEADLHHPPVLRIHLPHDHSALLAAVDQRDRAVVFRLHAIGQLTDRRPVPPRVALDVKHELVLQRGQALAAADGFAVSEKTAQAKAEFRQGFVMPLADRARGGTHGLISGPNNARSNREWLYHNVIS